MTAKSKKEKNLEPSSEEANITTSSEATKSESEGGAGGIVKKVKEGALVLREEFDRQIVDKYVRGTAIEQHMGRVDEVAQLIFKQDYKDENEAVTAAKGPIRVGMICFIVLFVLIGGWSIIARVDSAAVAVGTVVLDSNKKIIQHLEGGIVADLLVIEGQSVDAGEPLLRLSETNARARRDILLEQIRTARATEARLVAERDGEETISFPEILMKEREEPTVKKIMDTQERLFETQRKALTGKVEVLGQRINQFRDEIIGREAQRKSFERQLELIDEEITTVAKLLEAGHEQKPRLLALQRKQAELNGNIGEFTSLIAKAEQSIAENELEILNIKNEGLNQTMKLLKDTQVEMSDLEERLRAAEDVLNRIVITSPQAGVVTGLKIHTVGGVIQPGGELMAVVPQDDRLIIEARISPQDIDVVHEGLNAKIRLSAYKTRTVPILDGKVLNVSADRFIDQVSGEPYFIARVAVDEKMIQKIKNDKVELYPGMPAEVYVVTGERSPIRYFFDPILDNFRRAFREQ